MRYSKPRTLNIDRTPQTCSICGRTFIGKGLKSHIKQVHNPELDAKLRGPKQGNVPWNVGLTKETDERLLLESIRRKGRPGTFVGRHHTEETKRKISLVRSANNKGGRCKWYEVDGQKVQGTWELNVATKLTSMGIKWIKLKTNQHTFVYVREGKQHSYTPDFYIPDVNIYLEIKGYWWGNDKEKMNIVKTTYPDIQIIVVEYLEYMKILEGELVW
jgi:hypothetical protein